ncbi:biotin--[acetyl-CoA-carboxylase] ligase [Marinicella sp. W31]|uniref:biotin--[acetyl-CoA-carboxylase] ligase n=1 Tax=Marinicella sp. W31 TaxID=3023713 RepID=UPI0037581702
MDTETSQQLTIDLAQTLFQDLCKIQTIDIKKSAQKLDVKRLSLQQALNWLTDTGLVLHSAGPERWRLQTPVQALSQLQHQQIAGDLPLHYIFSTTSTNTEVVNNSILIADHQSQGQGRSGRTWITPPGQSLCFSYCRLLPQDPQTLSGLSIVTALSVIHALQPFDRVDGVQLKWPNDIYRLGKKAGGILLQLEPAHNNMHRMVIGVGLNWCAHQQLLDEIDQPCTNLVENVENLDRAEFLTVLLNRLHTNVEQFLSHGLAEFLQDWRKYDFLHDKKIRIRHGLRSIEGQYQGLNSQGMLTIENNNELMTLASGEVSVRPL